MSDNSRMYEEPYTEEAAIKFTTEAFSKCDKLKHLADLDTVCVVLKNLSNSYFDFKEHHQKICDIIIKRNFVQTLNTIIENLRKLGYFSNDKVWHTTYYGYNFLWNYCNVSKEMTNLIVSSNLFKLIVENIHYEEYLNKLSDQNYYYLLKASVSIVHNVARFPDNQLSFNLGKLKETLVSLIKRDGKDFLGVVSMLALSVLVDETELKLLEDGLNTIGVLIEHIKTAHKSVDKLFDGFMIWELVNGLRCISANDNMKKSILHEGGLVVLLEVLVTPSNDDDVEKSLGALWNLCFDNEVTDNMSTVEAIRQAIKPYENHHVSEIKRNYDGIVWLLDNKCQAEKISATFAASRLENSERNLEAKYDIFMSYASSDKATVLSIKEELIKCNISVWVDSDVVQGSTMEITADVIESSQIFVMAVSNAYRSSPHCRLEFHHASSFDKPIVVLVMESNFKPSNWLGLIEGTKPSFTFYDRRYFHDTVRDLFTYIHRLLKNTDHDTRDSYITARDSCVETWSTGDVEKWLRDSELSHVASKLQTVSGRLLKSMVELSKEAPEFLYTTCRNEYGMTLVDILKLRLAIKTLSFK